MARLLFVNRFYWPDETATGQLLTDLAEALSNRGHDVTVIASRPPTLASGAINERHGVRIAHVGSTRANRGNMASKGVDLVTFFCGACWKLLRLTERDTIVIAMTDPPLIGIAAWLVAALRRARVIHWVQDIYPEVAIELAGQSWLVAVRPLRNAAWRRAACCVTLGPGMASRVRAAGVSPERLALIANWAPAGIAPASAGAVANLRRAWGLEGKFVVGYSGNLGRVHDLEPVLELAAALRDYTAIAFIFVGGGAQRTALGAAATERGLHNVSFLPAQPRDSLAAALGVPDLHLVTLRPGCEQLVFPSKLYGITASGRPVLFIGPRECDMARLVTAEGLGFAFTRDEISAAATLLRRLAQEPAEGAEHALRAIRFAAAHDATTATENWADLIGRVDTGAGT